MSNESNIDDDIARLQAKFQQKKAQADFQSPLFNQDSFYQQGFAQMSNQNGDSSMDDLLEQVRAQFQEKKGNQGNSQSSSAPSNQASRMEMDELLEQVRAEFEQPQKPESSSSNSTQRNSNSSLEDFLTQVRGEFKDKQQRLEFQGNSSDEDLFAEVKSNFEVKQSATANRNYEQTIDDVRHEEQQRQRQEKALRTQAQKWLKNLNPHSDEGIWFEEFAYSYPSRLEAAMDYLQALGET